MKPAVAPWDTPLYCLRIECQNGTIVRILEYPEDVEISGNTYLSDAGYQFTGYESGVTFAPGTLDFSSLVGLSPEITLANILAGIFDGADVYIFATDWSNPVEDEEAINKGKLGPITLKDDRYTAQVFWLVDLLNAKVGFSYSPLCPLEFGAQGYAQCGVDAVALQVAGVITGSTDNYNFADSTLGETDDYFGAGKIWFTSGDNLGVAAQRVKAYTATGGLIETNEPFPYVPEIGDAFIIEPGCRKRLEDCRDKFANVDRRLGFDWIPGIRFLNRIGGGE